WPKDLRNSTTSPDPIWPAGSIRARLLDKSRTFGFSRKARRKDVERRRLISSPKQHYVPRSYLAGWVDSRTPAGQEPYVWVFKKGEKKGRRKAPSNIFTETDLYTVEVESGGKNYAIEEALSKLESRFAMILREKITKHLPLGDEERAFLCAFVSAMLQRTLRHRDNLESFIDQIIKNAEILEREHKLSSTESDRLKRFRRDGHKVGMMRNLPDITRLLYKMSIAFL